MKLAAETTRLKQFLKQEVSYSKRILDIGCGDGATALYLISSLNCVVRGIDLDAGKVHRANEKFKRKPRKGFAVFNVLKNEDLRRKIFKKAFDAVIIIHTFHHLDNVKRTLAKSKNVLARHGKIIVAEYTAPFGERVDNCPRFSVGKIKSLIAEAGFKKIRQFNLSPALFAIAGFKY